MKIKKWQLNKYASQILLLKKAVPQSSEKDSVYATGFNKGIECAAKELFRISQKNGGSKAS